MRKRTISKLKQFSKFEFGTCLLSRITGKVASKMNIPVWISTECEHHWGIWWDLSWKKKVIVKNIARSKSLFANRSYSLLQMNFLQNIEKYLPSLFIKRKGAFMKNSSIQLSFSIFEDIFLRWNEWCLWF